ncbi:hypothetical protein ABLB69_06375 [Xenorhabdus khoisanae]|uniref:Uncharacterized protein n=1 Tax=Xenorhabdus khoisanae TaxID=880157 RepID=A0A0J5FUH8_9GAMM|nr:hypothetical protein [Xenorhabdus khoisanae]KMJ45908.1 hypothetical protein AB204_06425 [Xenorhabdus khoisanae]
MRNIKVFRGFYTFEDTYRGHLRLSVCSHGEYDENYFMGYLTVLSENLTVENMTPNELYDQLVNNGGIILDRFRYIHLVVCNSATCEKDRDSPYSFEESFASEFSKLCSNSIVIGYVGAVKVRHNYFNPQTLSYEHDKDIQRNEEVFRIGHICQLHFSELSLNQNARAAFRAEKEAYSRTMTVDPITPKPFLKPKEPGKPISNRSSSRMERHTSVWFKNGKRIHAEMLVL